MKWEEEGKPETLVRVHDYVGILHDMAWDAAFEERLTRDQRRWLDHVRMLCDIMTHEWYDLNTIESLMDREGRR